MNSSTLNSELSASPNLPISESVEKANEDNRRFADELVKAAVEGLNRLAREAAAAKKPPQAA